MGYNKNIENKIVDIVEDSFRREMSSVVKGEKTIVSEYIEVKDNLKVSLSFSKMKGNHKNEYKFKIESDIVDISECSEIKQAFENIHNRLFGCEYSKKYKDPHLNKYSIVKVFESSSEAKNKLSIF